MLFIHSQEQTRQQNSNKAIMSSKLGDEVMHTFGLLEHASNVYVSIDTSKTGKFGWEKGWEKGWMDGTSLVANLLFNHTYGCYFRFTMDNTPNQIVTIFVNGKKMLEIDQKEVYFQEDGRVFNKNIKLIFDLNTIVA